jgi:two-component system CheB/CheR fusion protein
MGDEAGRQSFLLRLSDALSTLTAPDAIESTACRMLGEHLNVDYVSSGDMDGDEFVIRQSWSRDRPLALSLTRGSLAAFGRTSSDLSHRGETVIVTDIATDARFTPEERKRVIAAKFRAFIRFMRMEGAKPVGLFGAGHCTPRAWTEAEIWLVHGVAHRIWAAVEHDRADTAIRQSEARLQRMLQTDAAGVLFLDRAGTIVGVNDCFLKMSGYSRIEADSREISWKQMTPAEWLEQSERQLQLCAMTGRIGPYEREYLRKDGTRGWWLIAGSELGDGTIAKIVIDIDQRKRAESALRMSEEQLAAELANMQVLQTISGQLVREQSPKRHFELIVDAAAQLMQSDAASLQEYDRRREKLKLVASRGFHADAATHWEWLSPRETMSCGQALQDGRRIVFEDIRKLDLSPEDRDAYASCGVRAVQSTPLVSHSGRVVGVLSTHWSHTHQAGDRAYRAFDVLARWAADLLVRTQIERDLHDTESRQKVLVAELQHRTRNIIAVVQSIAERSVAGASSLTEFSAGFNSRLNALARVQGLLSRSDSQPITIGALVRMELEAVAFSGATDRIRVSGPYVRLRNAIVQTLALALHELTTNALKHGALSKKNGTLDISWELRENAGRCLVLKWLEQGLHLAPEQRNYSNPGQGLELIEQALPYSLGAQTCFRLEETGAVCTIVLPLDAPQRKNVAASQAGAKGVHELRPGN